MKKRLDVAGSVMVLLGMILAPVCIGALCTIWIGLLIAAVELILFGLLLCDKSAGMEPEEKAQGTSGTPGGT